jgi:hypothetical protein
MTGGAIVSSQIKMESHKSDLLYRADVRYTYEVSGHSYEGKRVSFSFGEGASSDKALAQHVVDRYPVGTAVQIAYDPTNSKKSVLEPGVHVSSLLVFFVVLLLMLLFMLTGSAILISNLLLLLQRQGRRNA